VCGKVFILARAFSIGYEDPSRVESARLKKLFESSYLVESKGKQSNPASIDAALGVIESKRLWSRLLSKYLKTKVRPLIFPPESKIQGHFL
jgi:hypothetical protein